MAKPATLQIRLVSTADTGYFYVTKKNPRTKPEKLEVMKYDPRVRKHGMFKISLRVPRSFRRLASWQSPKEILVQVENKPR